MKRFKGLSVAVGWDGNARGQAVRQGAQRDAELIHVRERMVWAVAGTLGMENIERPGLDWEKSVGMGEFLQGLTLTEQDSLLCLQFKS